MNRTFPLAFVVATTVILSGCSASADMAVAEKEVSQFHLMLDNGQYDAVYDQLSSASLKKTVSKQTLVAFLDSMHTKLGVVKSSTSDGWTVNYDGDGEHIVLKYKTVFAGGTAEERFDFRKDADQILLLAYHITPQGQGTP